MFRLLEFEWDARPCVRIQGLRLSMARDLCIETSLRDEFALALLPLRLVFSGCNQRGGLGRVVFGGAVLPWVRPPAQFTFQADLVNVDGIPGMAPRHAGHSPRRVSDLP